MDGVAAVGGAGASVHADESAGWRAVYLCAADGDGMMVSLIESNYMGFGSGMMGGSTGIMLQNRGAYFSLDPDHPNALAPRLADAAHAHAGDAAA